MKIKNRQHLLLAVTLALVGLFALDKLVYGPLVEFYQKRSGRIVELRKRVTEGTALVQREKVVRARWEGMRDNTLPNNSSVAEQQLLKAYPKRQPAQDFSASPEGGLLHVSQRNQAVSYAFAPDRRLDLPDYVAAMDRDLRVTAAGRACSAGFSSVAAIDYLTPNEPAWTNELHFQSGNILSHDGRVDQISQSGLARRLRTSSWTGSLHLLIP